MAVPAGPISRRSSMAPRVSDRCEDAETDPPRPDKRTKRRGRGPTDGPDRRETRAGRRVTPLVSFDIDGTLEVGDPPGIVTIAMVRRIKLRGWLLGSCSDRPISYQQALWERLAIAPDFTVLKHRLAEIRTRFPAGAYYHIGDTEVDERYASGAGFEFLRADAAAHASWGPRLLGPAADRGR